MLFCYVNGRASDGWEMIVGMHGMEPLTTLADFLPSIKSVQARTLPPFSCPGSVS